METYPNGEIRNLRLRRVWRIGLNIAVDLVIAIGAYLLTIVFLMLTDGDYVRFKVPYANLFLNACVLALALLAFGVYRRIWQRTSGHGVMLIVNAMLAASLATIVLTAALRQQDVLPLQVIVLGNVSSLVGFVAIRYRSRLASGLRWRWRAFVFHKFPSNPTRVLIVGAGESGQVLAWQLKHRFRQNLYQVIGFIDDDVTKRGMYVEGCPIIGARNDIIELAERHNVDLIVVAIHNISGPSFREILTICEKTKALIKVVPDIQGMVSAQHTTEVLRDVQAEDLIGRTPITQHESVDLSPVKGKVILVTGAAGSIGSELCRQIMSYAPSRLVILDNNESGLYDLAVELGTKHPDVHFVEALVDITVRQTLAEVFRTHQPQIVFHAAAYKHVPMLEHYPSEAVRVNLRGTRNLVQLAQEFHVERFVLISTDKAVKPSSVMGASKRLCELMLHALSLQPETATRYAAVRFGNVLGSRGSVVPTFNRQIDRGGPVTVTHQDMTRYFMSIPEAVNLIIHAASMTDGDDIYVLQMGEVVRIVDLAERMIRLRGLRPYRDIEIKFTGIRPGEKMHEELFNEIETPNETLHPNIMQVNTWREDFESERFWSEIETLVNSDFSAGAEALAAMTRIITPPPAPADSNGVANSLRVEQSVPQHT
ncbi:MAG: polysaccharide biosynthesis protein [Anaerolineae bacterium]|nr:polysaccharide biosynthesis protein [Anaerolineae bacterium]